MGYDSELFLDEDYVAPLYLKKKMMMKKKKKKKTKNGSRYLLCTAVTYNNSGRHKFVKVTISRLLQGGQKN